MSDTNAKPGGTILMAAFLLGLVGLGLTVSLLAPFKGGAAHQAPAHPGE